MAGANEGTVMNPNEQKPGQQNQGGQQGGHGGQQGGGGREKPASKQAWAPTLNSNYF